jgi:hypothetical protein
MAGQGPGAGADAIGVAMATAIASVIIAKLSGKVADVLTGSGDDNDEKMYDEFHKKIGKSSFRLPAKKTGSTVGRKIKTVMDQPSTMAFVTGAIDQLQKAKKSTHCGVCQKKLDAAITAVVQEAEVIRVSDAKYQIMKDLKKAGKIPTTSTWNQLSPEQKTFINKIAEKGV